MGDDWKNYYINLETCYTSYSERIRLGITECDVIPIYIEILFSFGIQFLALMNFVAISLLVTIETVKFGQGVFIEYDLLMYDQEKDMAAKAQTTNINEELGMVNYIFSDKTGTLTKNIMEFKKFSAGLKSYGQSSNEDNYVKYDEGVTNVNFYDE